MRWRPGTTVDLADGRRGTVVATGKFEVSVLIETGEIVTVPGSSLSVSVDRCLQHIQRGVAAGLWEVSCSRRVFDKDVPPTVFMQAGKDLLRLYRKANPGLALARLAPNARSPWWFGVELVQAATGGKRALSLEALRVPTFSISRTDPIEEPGVLPRWDGAVPARDHQPIRRRRR